MAAVILAFVYTLQRSGFGKSLHEDIYGAWSLWHCGCHE